MDILTIILIAVIIDIILGEPPSKIHPVVLMGELINILKNILTKYNNKISGVVLTITTLFIFISIFGTILKISTYNPYLYVLISAILLSTTFAIKSLFDSVKLIKKDIDISLVKARHSLSYLVSRDTSKLSKTELISADIETLTENITDSIISPLIYAFLFGVLGAVFYRVVNTLDAMVGYKNPENINIGWFPAKLDDILNYFPARITGWLVIIASFFLKLNWKNAYKIMMRDAKKTPSPNSGYPMAATAGALGIQLKKPGYYELGDNINPLTSETILKAIQLTKITIIIFLILSSFLFIIFTIFIMS
ncbi:cobalamin biosynthesis protein [Methanobacterium spitsbergense]|uniref:Probable cobalamin biosynthesis protein CobD n=1 Tax=Methanobacterium spitsbergense TaxID=2874285 RepID=A0A8T5V046_9EURY|nr:cobalamin biosynthesis protein [Methanobacterium spitsbergense]MBZ2165055.1 cobalamin biosynthesis protein [Methanobacterium spitsbergense]